MKKTAAFLAAGLALAAGVSGARAQSMSAEPMSGMSGMGSRADISSLPQGPADLSLGAQIAQNCVTCHQTRGHDIVGIPPISGFAPELFEREMMAFKTKSREHVVMNAVAASLSDVEIVAVATYFSTLPSAH